MHLQRTIGNRGVGRMLGLSGSGGPGGRTVQRSLEDSKEIVWDHHKLLALWIKMKDRSEGKDALPAFHEKFRPESGGAETKPETIAMELGNGARCTEREMAERLLQHPDLRQLFLQPRLRQIDDEVELDGLAGDDAIAQMITACLYYHVTFTDNVADIKEGGLRAGKGGGGDGVSEHGRDDAKAKDTYNKWSKGHVFITKSRAEAKGYLEKMAQKRQATVIHLFSMPYFTRTQGKVDIDSKAGIKVDGDMRAVGDGESLNAQAVSLIASFSRACGLPVEGSEVQRVYSEKIKTYMA